MLENWSRRGRFSRSEPKVRPAPGPHSGKGALSGARCDALHAPECGVRPSIIRHPGDGGRSWITRVITLLLALFMAAAWADVPVPPLTARVIDQTHTLDAANTQALEAKLAALEQSKGAQIAVLMVSATTPESIEQYALRVAEAWKLGRKGVDDGALLLIAKDERALRIEVGYGLEGAIPDALAKRIIAEIIVPRFKAGDFAGGVEAGVDALIKLVQGEPLPAPDGRRAEGSGLGEHVPLLMMFIFVAGGLLRSLFGRLPGAAVAGGVAFLGAWLLLGGVLVALLVALVAFVFTLAGGGRGIGGGSGHPGGWGGGGGLGGGGFGGGGFGGGGGGFGGGGASGRW